MAAEKRNRKLRSIPVSDAHHGAPCGKPDQPEQIEKALTDWRKDIADRECAENELRKELIKARIEYEVAQASFDQAAREAQNIGLNHPDGAHGMFVATRHYREALRRYRQTLQTYTDSVHENSATKQKSKIPEDF